jgi:hypothetical protein
VVPPPSTIRRHTLRWERLSGTARRFSGSPASTTSLTAPRASAMLRTVLEGAYTILGGSPAHAARLVLLDR